MPAPVLAFLAGLAVFYFVALIPLWFLLPEHLLSWVLQIGVSGWVGFRAGRWVLARRTGNAPPPGLATSILVGALAFGTVGFLLGFVGPMLLAPGANQGPLLGIFITGPGGALLGAVAGALHGSMERGRGADAPTRSGGSPARPLHRDAADGPTPGSPPPPAAPPASSARPPSSSG